MVCILLILVAVLMLSPCTGAGTTAPISPGDALRVRARFESKYDANGDLLDQRVTIIQVYGAIHPASPAKGLFDEAE